jgi:hypothetical protein
VSHQDLWSKKRRIKAESRTKSALETRKPEKRAAGELEKRVQNGIETRKRKAIKALQSKRFDWPDIAIRTIDRTQPKSSLSLYKVKDAEPNLQ